MKKETTVHQSPNSTLCNLARGAPICDEPFPLLAPSYDLVSHVFHAERLADPAEESIVRFDEEVRRKDGEDRLERGVGGGELLCGREKS